MAGRMRAHDWDTTPLGPLEHWPQRLKTVTDLLLCSRRANYILYGPSLTLIYNDVYIPMLGAKHPSALGRPYQEVWPETWVQSEHLLMAALQGKAQYFVDCPFSFPDDAEHPIRWFTFTWTPLRDSEGVVRGLYASSTETTKQVLAQEQLRESEERLRFVTGRAGVGCWSFNIETLRVECSPLFTTILGIPEPENGIISYEDVLAQVHPEDRERVKDTGYACLLRGNDYDMEYRAIMPDGSNRWIHARGGATTDPDRPISMAGIVLDVTARKEAEEALRRSEQRYRQLVEQMVNGLFVTDSDGYFIDANAAGCAMLGMTLGELIGKHARDVIVPEEHPRLGLELKRLKDYSGVQTTEWRMKRKDGSRFIGEVTVSKLANGSKQAILRDITERKRHEEQIQLLIREVNHRAKNILAVVQAVARQTAASNPDDFVERLGERIGALAASQDLLVKSQWTGVKLAELVRSQLAHFSDLIGTRIVIKGPEAVISAAAAQTLGMAIHELSANASKYGALSNDQGLVSVEWEMKQPAGQEAVFEMVWCEKGGPAVTKPSKRGFGSTVISEMAQMALDAKVDLDFTASGFCWRLKCAAADILSERV